MTVPIEHVESPPSPKTGPGTGKASIIKLFLDAIYEADGGVWCRISYDAFGTSHNPSSLLYRQAGMRSIELVTRGTELYGRLR